MARGRGPGYLTFVHPPGPRAGPDVLDKGFKGTDRAFGVQFHPTVSQIADPAYQAVPARALAGEISEPHALNPAAHGGVYRRCPAPSNLHNLL